tara:strand:- start:453 stop:1322 length:870 start_codon:yes stop_codon:yes gene_type:complete
MAKDMSGGMLSRSRELQEAREEDIRRNEALRAVRLEIARLKEENPIPSEKVQEELAELERQREMFQNMQMGFEKATTDRKGKAEGGKFPDLTGDGKVTQADVLKGRGVFQEGGTLMMPTEGMPVDTYPNIPADEMDEAVASQLPDDEMEDDYIKYVMDESLSDEEQDYLAEALTKDSRLENILEKVMLTATEFSGAGEVDGPGTGVSDSIPARLSDGEFVFTKKATDQIGADNLQRMMDDAERAFDGGYQMKAVGGMMEDEDPENLGMSQTQEEIEKLMMGANRMPSLQ